MEDAESQGYAVVSGTKYRITKSLQMMWKMVITTQQPLGGHGILGKGCPQLQGLAQQNPKHRATQLDLSPPGSGAWLPRKEGTAQHIPGGGLCQQEPAGRALEGFPHSHSNIPYG